MIILSSVIILDCAGNPMNPSQLIQQQNNLLKLAESELTQSNQLMESFITHWKETIEQPLDDFESLHGLKLVLQYRLDTQSTLNQLNSLQLYLRQMLGIEPQHTLDMNLERLSYALGTDDLRQLLTMLNHMVDSLTRILAHHLNQQALDRQKGLLHLKRHQSIELLTKAIEKQNAFSAHCNEVKLTLENIGGAPHPGVIYDHLAALDGPISRFHQALQHGLVLGYSVYQQLEQKNRLQLQLTDTVQNPNQLMHHMNYSSASNHLFTQSPGRTPAERLEERASAKRLGNFFNH